MGAYEDRVLGSTALQGVVLRYGFFYGPGHWYRPDGASAEQARKGMSTIIGDGPGVWSFVHIDYAVAATVEALDRKSVVEGRSVSVSADLCGRSTLKKTKTII